MLRSGRVVADDGDRCRVDLRRRLATWLCVGFGVLLLVAGMIISFLVGSPFSWAGFLIVGGIIFFHFAGFVWIRLAD